MKRKGNISQATFILAFPRVQPPYQAGRFFLMHRGAVLTAFSYIELKLKDSNEERLTGGEISALTPVYSRNAFPIVLIG
jgi:hypothetical protein